MGTIPPHTGRTIEKEIFIHAMPGRVFRALTEKAELERWFLTEATVDVRPGGASRFAWQNDVATGVFREVNPPRRLVYGWEEANGLGMTIITFTLTPEGDGTRLHLVHTGFGSGPQWDDVYTGTDRGWICAVKGVAETAGSSAPLVALLGIFYIQVNNAFQ